MGGRGEAWAPDRAREVMRRLAAVFLTYLVIAVVLVQPAIATTVTIPAGASIQAAIDANPTGTTFQLAAGSWRLSATLKPKAGDRILGAGMGTTILGGVTQTFDGIASPKAANVEIAQLTLRGFLDGVQVASGWYVHNIEATANQVGVKMIGTGPVVSDSKIHHNARYGAAAFSSSDGQFLRNDVSYNRTDTSLSTGSSGATKWSQSTGWLVDGNTVHDNYGRGLWLDGEDHGCTISNNVVQNNQDDGIRVEIGYGSVITGNQVTGNLGPAVNIQNSSGTVVRGNTISAPASQPLVLRFYGSGRKSSSGVEYTNTNNRATANTITLSSQQVVGVGRIAGTTSGNSFDLNSYLVPSLTISYFKWWDGSAQQTVAWGGWQGFGQDLNGHIAVP